MSVDSKIHDMKSVPERRPANLQRQPVWIKINDTVDFWQLATTTTATTTTTALRSSP
jgi:hypothetical protein